MKENRLSRIAVIIGILLPPVTFFWMFFSYTVDIPVNDDYKAVLNFINQIINAESFSEKLSLIFSQHNEHRIVYDRLWTIISYKLQGHVDFNTLAFIGNLSLAGIFAIFYKKWREASLSLIYLLPVSVLLFNISFWENMTFAMAALSNFTIFMFSLASLYFITKKEISRVDTILSMSFFVMAVFTQGGGLMLIPVIAAILWYRKQHKVLYVFLGLSLLLAAFYFYGYQKPDEATTLSNTLTNLKIRSLLFSFAFLGNAFNYYLIFTNDINDSIAITTIIGVFFLACYLYAAKTRYYQKNLFSFAVMSLVVITSFATGFSRSHMGLETAGASRYRIAGIVFVIALLFWAIDTFGKSKNIKPVVIVASTIYFLFFGLNQYEYLSYRKYKSMMGALRYHSGDYSQLNGFEQEYYNKVLASSAENDTYVLPSQKSLESFFPFSAVEGAGGSLTASQMVSSVDNIAKINDSFILDGYAFDQLATGNQQKSIGLKSADGNIVYFSAKTLPRFDLNPYFHKFNLRDCGYFARIKLANIKPGSYKIVIRLQRDGETRLFETDKTLNY